jgi:hypothetical protein
VLLQGFVEGPGLGLPESPLQFVFFGSNQEKVIHQRKKWFNAIDGAGVKVAAVTLPPAPVGLLRSIMLHNKQASPLLVGPSRLFFVFGGRPNCHVVEANAGPLSQRGLPSCCTFLKAGVAPIKHALTSPACAQENLAFALRCGSCACRLEPTRPSRVSSSILLLLLRQCTA